MIRKTRTLLTASIILLALVILPAGQRAFSNVDIGSEVKNEILPTLTGDKIGFLGDEEEVHFFFFFKPDQEKSLDFLRELEGLHRDLKDRSIYWTAIVSDRYDSEIIREAVDESGLKIPVLLDRSDKLFGTLGVALHPVVGMTDGDHILRVYLHYQKVNFMRLIRANLLHLFGDISDEELARIADPEDVVQGGDTVAAQRLLKLAQMLFKAGQNEIALARTNESIEKDPVLVSAHILLGNIQLANGNGQAAALAFQRALEIDPDNAEAQKGLQLCGEGD